MPPNLPDSDLDEDRSSSSESETEDIQASVPQTQVGTDEDIKKQSDQESNNIDMKSKKRKRGVPKQEPKKAKIEPDEAINSDGDEDGGDVYEVEKIVDHRWQGKRCLYRVRWKGFQETEDTWETEENLEGSSGLLAQYIDKIGGKPQPPKSVRKTGSKANLKEKVSTSKGPSSEDGSSPTPKRTKRSGNRPLEPNTKEWDQEDVGSWVPTGQNTASWEDLVHAVETVERDENGNLFAYIRFKNGRRTKVVNSTYVQRCPRKMLEFYENHLSV